MEFCLSYFRARGSEIEDHSICAGKLVFVLNATSIVINLGGIPFTFSFQAANGFDNLLMSVPRSWFCTLHQHVIPYV